MAWIIVKTTMETPRRRGISSKRRRMMNAPMRESLYRTKLERDVQVSWGAFGPGSSVQGPVQNHWPLDSGHWTRCCLLVEPDPDHGEVRAGRDVLVAHHEGLHRFVLLAD